MKNEYTKIKGEVYYGQKRINLKVIYRGTNLSEIERIKSELFIDRMLSATDNKYEAINFYSANWNNAIYKVSLKEGTGFTHVIYSEDGLTPNYDSHTPFEISVQKLINGQWGDLTGHSSLTYNWSVIGNLKIKSGYTNTFALPATLLPGAFD